MFLRQLSYIYLLILVTHFVALNILLQSQSKSEVRCIPDRCFRNFQTATKLNITILTNLNALLHVHHRRRRRVRQR